MLFLIFLFPNPLCIGRNGSAYQPDYIIEYPLIFTPTGGKSAVLTAITIALGGKASLTGRGSGLKSFIREGQRYRVTASAFCNTIN